MSIRKHATGEVLVPQDEEQPTADGIQVVASQQDWTSQDEFDLADESTQG